MFESFMLAALAAAAPLPASQERAIIAKTVSDFEEHVTDPNKIRFRQVRLGTAEMMGGKTSLMLCGKVAFDDPRLPAGWNTFYSILSNGNFSVGASAETICNSAPAKWDSRDFSVKLKAAFAR